MVLVGLPGCGKSTVGRELARRLGLAFYDSDRLIEQRAGCSISDLFARDGEEAFRDVEESVLQQLLETQSGVLATGGGAVLRPANRQRLREFGPVVYLRSSPEELFRRLRHDAQRPLLQVEDKLTRLRELFAQRDPLYCQTAHLVIDMGNPSVPRLVKTVLRQLELAGELPARP